jgi:hypothetical protein
LPTSESLEWPEEAPLIAWEMSLTAEEMAVPQRLLLRAAAVVARLALTELEERVAELRT